MPELTADPLFVGATRPPMRWGVTYSALLFNMVLPWRRFFSRSNLLTLLLCAPIHGVCALLCARDATLLRSVAALGAHASAGVLANAAALAGEQLQPAPARSAGRARPAQRSGSPSCSWPHWRAPMLARARAAALRRERDAAEHIPYSAHVAARVISTAFGRLPAGLSAGRRELRERR